MTQWCTEQDKSHVSLRDSLLMYSREIRPPRGSCKMQCGAIVPSVPNLVVFQQWGCVCLTASFRFICHRNLEICTSLKLLQTSCVWCTEWWLSLCRSLSKCVRICMGILLCREIHLINFHLSSHLALCLLHNSCFQHAQDSTTKKSMREKAEYVGQEKENLRWKYVADDEKRKKD